MSLNRLIFCLFLNLYNIIAAPNSPNKLVIILVDGFRSDYAKKIANLSAFQDVLEAGVTAEYVTPVFPANTYPNMYSIATGVYAENHGFVANFIFDAEKNESFLIGTNKASSEPYWWNASEPLWISAEKEDIKTALYFWDGCQVEINKTKPYICLPYPQHAPSNSEIENALSEVTSKFIKNEVQLAFVYYELVDKKGHLYGPFSSEVNKTVQDFDKILSQFRKNLTDNSLSDKVNIILISDHGMTSISPEKEVKIYKYANVSKNEGNSFPEISTIPIYSKEDKITELYNNLKKIPSHAKVYRKDSYPEKWHYKNNPRTADLLVLADEGYILLQEENGWKRFTFNDTENNVYNRKWGGMHGYDNTLESMRSFFAAVGPSFKKGYLNRPIQQVDVYNVMCNIMNIQPHPNNGTWDNVKYMLKNSSFAFPNKNIWLIFLCLIINIIKL